MRLASSRRHRPPSFGILPRCIIAEFPRPPEMKSLKVHADNDAHFSVVVRHYFDGVEQKRFATLFPGETSFAIEV